MLEILFTRCDQKFFPLSSVIGEILFHFASPSRGAWATQLVSLFLSESWMGGSYYFCGWFSHGLTWNLAGMDFYLLEIILKYLVVGNLFIISLAAYIFYDM